MSRCRLPIAVRASIALFLTFLAQLVVCRAQADSAQIYLDCLVDYQRYGDSIWHTASYSNAPANSGYFGDGASTDSLVVRGLTGTVRQIKATHRLDKLANLSAVKY